MQIEPTTNGVAIALQILSVFRKDTRSITQSASRVFEGIQNVWEATEAKITGKNFLRTRKGPFP